MSDIDVETNVGELTASDSIRDRRHRSSGLYPDRHWSSMRDDPAVSESWGHSPSYVPRSALDGKYRDDNGDAVDFVDDKGVHDKLHHTSVFEQLRGDYWNIALLLFLYVLQGIPLGLTSSIPLILQSRQVSYGNQAIFSFAYWPFSLKLLWAPLVDSIYWSRLGRRKSWLVPTQYLIGLSMYILSRNVTAVLGDDSEHNKPDVRFLTGIFFAFNFLAATQDIAVDGWGLTMLSKRNVGYCSTCNAVGQTAGWFIGNVVFLVLESKQFCNQYIFSTPRSRGLVTLAEFVCFWAIVFTVSTTLVLLFKKEVDHSTPSSSFGAPDSAVDQDDEEEEGDMDIASTYRLMLKILRLKPVLALLFIFMTGKLGFAAVDSISGLKLVEKGIPKEDIAFVAIPLVPLQIILPWVIGKYTSGPQPMKVFLRAYPYRLLIGLLFPVMIYFMDTWKQPNGSYPFSFFVYLVLLYCFHQVTVYSCFVATMAFSAQVSDPRVGGTYMTLLNTVNNLGGNWPTTLLMGGLDRVTWRSCIQAKDGSVLATCVTDADCTVPGSTCQITTDGYYAMCIVTTIIGFIWYFAMRKRVSRLQFLEKKAWTVQR